MTPDFPPVLVTGLPRSGTSWVGKMLEASGQLVYVNEPMNPAHPPGRSPGVLDADVAHYFHYICADNEEPWRRAFTDTLRLRYRPLRELGRNHRPYDLARAAKYGMSFSHGRLAGRRALLDDPYALFATPWLVDRMGVRAVVLVRDPAALVGSWRRLGWRMDTAELLNQPLLMRDHLEPFRDALDRAKGGEGSVAAISTLWNATTSAVLSFAEHRPSIAVRRYEDLSQRPGERFAELYRWLGLPWTDRARSIVAGAVSGGDPAPAGFRWSLRGGLSRTAFRPMDAGRSLLSYRDRLTEQQIDTVRRVTASVAGELDRFCSD